MDWLKQLAPLLGTALGGPLGVVPGAVAGGLISTYANKTVDDAKKHADNEDKYIFAHEKEIRKKYPVNSVIDLKPWAHHPSEKATITKWHNDGHMDVMHHNTGKVMKRQLYSWIHNASSSYYDEHGDIRPHHLDSRGKLKPFSKSVG